MKKIYIMNSVYKNTYMHTYEQSLNGMFGGLQRIPSNADFKKKSHEIQ